MKTLVILIVIFSTTACSVDWENKQANKITTLEAQIVELKKEKENDLFKKRQDCAGKADKLRIDAEKLKEVDSITSYDIGDVFYSPKDSICYFTVFAYTNVIGRLTIELKQYGSTASSLGTSLRKCESLKSGDCDDFDAYVRDLKKDI